MADPGPQPGRRGDHVSYVGRKLGKRMVKATKRNDVAAVEFLLKAGVQANWYFKIGSAHLTLMGYALTKNLEIAKLLRKYRALLVFTYMDTHFENPYSESASHICQNYRDVIVPGAYEWLSDEVACRAGSEPLATYDDDFDATPIAQNGWPDLPGPPRNVHTSWPPNVSLEGCKESVRNEIEAFWYAAGNSRRGTAKWHSRSNWRKFRRMVRMRGIAMFWLGITQVSGCKPEGVLRKRDREAYEEADMFS